MIRRALMQISIPSRVTTTAGWLLLAPRVAAAFSSHAPSLIVEPLTSAPSFAIHSVFTRACNTQSSFRPMSSSSSLGASPSGADNPLSPTKWSDLLSTNPTNNQIHWTHATNLFPPLTPTAHKGSHGRIAIFGGSEKYTGAPYYAAQSALHAGIDLATVFCANEAAVPIKCYSPELMVQGVYSVADLDALLQEEDALLEEMEQCKHQNEVNESDVLATMEKLEQHSTEKQQLLIQNELKNNDDDKMEVLVERLAKMKRIEEKLCQLRERRDVAVNGIVDTITDMFPTLHALCIGPGLGRHPLVFLAVEKVIQKAMACNLTLVLDADALFMLSLTEYRSLLKELRGYERCVMTPNLMEMRRLDTSMAAEDENADEKYDSSIIVQKGYVDKIIQGDKTMQCEEEGGLKRSGGIGDVLAGTISAFMAWDAVLETKSKDSISESSAVNGGTAAMQQPQMMQQRQFASWAACVAVKRATRVAYQTKRRAMSAMDVIGEIGQVLDGMEGGLALEIINQVEQEKSKSLQN